MDRPASAKLRSLEDGREVCTIAAGAPSVGAGDASDGELVMLYDAEFPWNGLSSSFDLTPLSSSGGSYCMQDM